MILRALASIVPWTFLAALATMAVAAPQRERIRSEMPDDYDLQVNLIRQACQTGDLPAVEAVVAGATSKWAESAPPVYVRFLRIACDEVRSRVFANQPRARALLHTWAEIAIEKADVTQIDVQVHLVLSCMRIDDHAATINPNEWRRERRASTGLWLKIWRNLEDSIDPSWSPYDPKYEISAYVPPPGVPFRAGMSPDDVRDPKIRDEYKAHLQRNRQLTEFNKRQQTNRKLMQEHRRDFEDYITSIYLYPPYDADELQASLEGLKDENMKQGILQRVREKGR